MKEELAGRGSLYTLSRGGLLALGRSHPDARPSAFDLKQVWHFGHILHDLESEI